VHGTRIRFHGIDAPEHDEPGGPEAKTALSRFIGEADVNCAVQETEPTAAWSRCADAAAWTSPGC
jgi:endonuclease YncB( thermonuclease family)